MAQDNLVKNKPKKKRRFFLIFYILPAFVIYTMFMASPLIMSLWMSLYKWSGIGKMTFAGFDNFKKLFFVPPFNERFIGAVINNIEFFAIMMIIQNLLALIIAVLLTRGLRGSKFFRTIFFAPVTISVVIVGFLFTLIYNPRWGVLNAGLKAVGLESLAMTWLGNESTALPCVAIAGAWQYLGLPVMMFVAAVQAVPEDLYEAGKISGCNEWGLFRYITLPSIIPTIGMVTVLTLIGNFANSFDLIFAMQGTYAGPNYSTDVLSTFFYRTAFGTYGSPGEMGLAAAIAACMFIVIGLGVFLWLFYDNKRRQKV